MNIEMSELPFPPIGEPCIDHVLTTSITLTDTTLSKEPVLILEGETVKLRQSSNFGYVIHKEHGIFRV